VRGGQGAGGTGLVSRCALVGDFETEVTFEVRQLGTAHYSLRLGAYDLEEGRFGTVGMNWDRYAYTLILPHDAKRVSPSDVTGELRLARTGKTVRGYFRRGDRWVLVSAGTVNDKPTRVNLDLGTNEQAFAGGVGAFRNFRARSTSAECR
jgi:hypothetical protein